MRRWLRHPDLPPLAFLLFASLLVVAPALLTGRALLPADALFNFQPWKPLAAAYGVTVPHNDLAADMILQNYSWKELVKSSYLSAEFPLWNPAILTGLPLLAAGQASPLYPLGLPLFLLLPTAHAYAWFMALHLFIAAAGAYALVRVLGGGRLGGAVAGLTFGLCGFLIVSFQWPQMVAAAAWMPALLACLERLVQRAASADPGRPAGLACWSAAGAVLVGLQLLAGHLEISFYALFTLLVYFLFRLATLLADGLRWPAVGYAVAGAGAMVGTGLLLAAVQLVPFAELIRQNVRAGDVTFTDVVRFALPKLQLVAFAIPDFFGNPTHHTYYDLFKGAGVPVEGSRDLAGALRSYPFWGAKNYVEGTAYVGLLPLLLAGLALLAHRNRHVLFFGGYGAVCLLLAFGSPLYAVFFFGLPGMDQLHTPFRWVLPYSLCVAVLAGFGVDALLERGRTARLLGPVVAVGGVLAVAALTVVYHYRDALLAAAEALRAGNAALAAAFPTVEMLFSYEFRNAMTAAALLGVSGVALWLAARRSSGALRLLVPVMLLVDLSAFAWGYLAFSDARIPQAQPGLVGWLAAQTGGPFRVAAYRAADVLPPDTAMLAGVQDIRGYDTVIPRQYVAFWRLMEEPSGLPYSQINQLSTPEALNSPLLDLLNVRFVFAREPLPEPRFRPVYQQQDVTVYENRDALPRAWLAYAARPATGVPGALGAMTAKSFDARRSVVVDGPPLDGPARSAEAAAVVSYMPNKVVVRAAPSQSAYLLLADAYFDGWQAQDAAEHSLEVVRADGVFRAVLLTPGEHTVTFTYRPVSFRLGAYLSFLGGVLLVLMGGYVVWQRRFSGATPTSAAARVARNSITPLTAQVLARFVDFGFAVFMLRWLGPSDYGGYAFAVVLIGYFATVTDFGLGTLITREVARDRTLAGRYLTNAVVARLALCLVLAPVLVAVAGGYHLWFGLQADAALTALLFMLSLAPGGVAGAISAVFSAHERMEYQAGMTIVTTVLRALLGLVALVAGWGVIGLGAVSVLANLFNLAAFWVLLHRSGLRLAWAVDLTAIRTMLAASTPLLVNALLNSIFFRIDVLVLQAMRGPDDVAYYSTAYKFIDGLLLVSSFFTLAFFPVMSQYAREAPERLLATYRQALKALLVLGLPIAVGVTAIAEPLIRGFFGEAFAPAARALQLLVWFLPFSYVNGLTQYVLIAVDRQRYLTRAFLAAALFNLAGNLLLVPAFGTDGAAAMTVLSEWVLLVPFMVGVARHVGHVGLPALALRPVVAAAAMAGVIWALGGVSLPLAVAAGSAAYGVALHLLRVIGPEDVAVLRRVFRR